MANLTGASQLDSTGIPTGSLKVPGVTLLKAIQGGALFTDGLGDDSAPIRAELTPGSKATYTYSINALALLASHTDLLVLRGSATKLVKVIHFELSGLITTSAEVLAYLKKHTIADTGGTGTLTATATKHDSADGAQTAVINTYQTTLPTVDASATIFRTIRMQWAPAATTVTLPDRWIQDFGNNGGEPLVLRGVAQEFALNFNAITYTGGLADFSIVWTEE
jgi:hypothetical protein